MGRGWEIEKVSTLDGCLQASYVNSQDIPSSCVGYQRSLHTLLPIRP